MINFQTIWERFACGSSLVAAFLFGRWIAHIAGKFGRLTYTPRVTGNMLSGSTSGSTHGVLGYNIKKGCQSEPTSSLRIRHGCPGRAVCRWPSGSPSPTARKARYKNLTTKNKTYNSISYLSSGDIRVITAIRPDAAKTWSLYGQREQNVFKKIETKA